MVRHLCVFCMLQSQFLLILRTFLKVIIVLKRRLKCQIIFFFIFKTTLEHFFLKNAKNLGMRSKV